MKIFFIHLLITVVTGIAFHESLSERMSGLPEFGVYLALFFVFWLSSYLYSRSYFQKFHRSLDLLLYFVKELFISNLKIIYYIITPRLDFRPAILRFPLRLKSENGIALLANLITLTPGTISMEVSRDQKYLYFHSINVADGDLEKAREKIRNGFEKRILAILE